MKQMKIKYLAFLALTFAALFASAAIVTKDVSKWSGGGSSLTAAVNGAKDTDTTIIRLTKDLVVNSDVEVRGGTKGKIKKIIITSDGDVRRTIRNRSYTYRTRIYAGATLVMSNIVYDCAGEEQAEDVFLLDPQSISGSTTNVARMILEKGATVKDAVLTSSTRAENAVFHVKEGAVLTIRDGAEILNCRNNSNPGKGGAICCDYGTIIMTGGTIAGCWSKGDGGAIHTDGTRVETADHYGINARGDIYISGGYITNNTCAAGKRGGGIYLGNSGPVLHITGTAVISNNLSGTVADDVSTFGLDNRYANRLKLVDYHESHPEGFTYAGQLFTGWVGVRYPMDNPEINQRFGAVWEYFNGSQEEARQFFWNGDNTYRGRMDGNALIWSKHVVHELPKDGPTVAEFIASGESPIYMELSEDYAMTKPAVVPENVELFLDLKGFNLKCDFHISNETARVTIFDSSTNKSGTVTGHRDSEYPHSFYLQGGSYATLPKPEWVATNCVVVGNYCNEHPYMVAIKVWDADHERVVTDLTNVLFENSDAEIREVTLDENGMPDVGNITFSSGDWKFMAYTNLDYRVQVLAAPAIQNENGEISECGPRVSLFDSHESSLVAPSNDEVEGEENSSSETFSNEDEFVWDAASYGLVKLIHITSKEAGSQSEDIAEEIAYFRFPEALFEATQRKTGGQLSIKVVDSLLTALGYNRVVGFKAKDVNENLDGFQANGLRKWENIVTGTAENQLLLSTAAEVEGGLSLKIALTDENKSGRLDTSYKVSYDLRKYASGTWTRVGEIMERHSFSVPLLDADGKSAHASGFYRVTTLIVPEHELSVTNEISSTNIVGVLEVASTLTNTLAAVPWVSLAQDPAHDAPRPITVSNYVHTSHLDHDDTVQVADKGHIYRKWDWDKHGKKWTGAKTVTKNAVLEESPADEHSISRDSAVWVTRKDPAAKPFFLIGQYSNAPVSLEIAGGSADAPVCTLVPNPTMAAVNVNTAYNWNGQPIVGDIIRIPNENKAPLVLRWNGSEWGRYVNSGRYSVWKNDATIPAGTGAWYMRCAGAFSVELPRERIEAQ